MNTRSVALYSILCAGLLLGAAARAAEVSTADLIAGLKSADEPARLKAIDELGGRGAAAAEAVTPLVELLNDKSAAVRAHALWALGSIGNAAKPAVPAMVDMLKDADANVRRNALKAVQEIHPGPQVTVPLATKLLEESDPAVRVRVMNAIAEAGASAVPGLIEALKNDKATYWALLILRSIGPEAKGASAAVAELLKDKRPEIRREAALTLVALGDADAHLPQIVALLSDENARTAATFVLGQLGKIPADAEKTVRENAKGGDKLLSTTSLWALARANPNDKDLRRDATEQLVARLKEKNPFVRAAAARALAALPPAPDITGPIFAKALQDADATTVQYALDALASVGAPAVPRLIIALKQEKTRSEVAYILGKIGPAAAPATDALAKLVEDKHSRVANEATLALANIGPGAKDAVPALIAALQKDKDLDLNFASIAYALGKIGPAAAAAQPVLEGKLKNEDRNVELLSAWALAQIHPKSADVAAKTVPVLIVCLGLPEAQQRRFAAEALADLGPLAKDATAALEKASGDKDAGVREAAAKALQAVGQAPAPSTAAAHSPKPGDLLVTLADGVSLRGGDAEIARLAKGAKVKVREIRGPWVGVEATVDGTVKAGWVDPKQIGSP